ncbi:aromatic amino acid lyase [Nostoc sp.]|uniref:aromatic amino acid lyase n=1 Tax=Nostoc sp. TaxID=1180 RepID=UPI002FF620B4
MDTLRLSKKTANKIAFFFVHSSDEAVIVGDRNLTVEEVTSVARYGTRVRLTDDLEKLANIQASCDFIRHAVESGEPIYGVTTGFGGMANVVISPESAALLQNNLMWYHKVGAGKKLPLADVRAAMLLRANSHISGASGTIQPQIVMKL